MPCLLRDVIHLVEHAYVHIRAGADQTQRARQQIGAGAREREHPVRHLLEQRRELGVGRMARREREQRVLVLAFGRLRRDTPTCVRSGRRVARGVVDIRTLIACDAAGLCTTPNSFVTSPAGSRRGFTSPRTILTIARPIAVRISAGSCTGPANAPRTCVRKLGANGCAPPVPSTCSLNGRRRRHASPFAIVNAPGARKLIASVFVRPASNPSMSGVLASTWFECSRLPTTSIGRTDEIDVGATVAVHHAIGPAASCCRGVGLFAS